MYIYCYSQIQMKLYFQTALDKFGRIDIVINNAGILRYKFLSGATENIFPIYRTNLFLHSISRLYPNNIISGPSHLQDGQALLVR